MTLEDFFAQVPKGAVAFSGGTDSSLLLWLAKQHGCDVRAYFVKTAFQPAFEWEDAQRLAAQLEIPLSLIEVDIFGISLAIANGRNRCYYCKQALFSRLWQQVREDGYPVLMDGTNASDSSSDRPGMRALAELSVRSPLRECGMTKEMVRKAAQEAGLFTWNKPSYACLATRIATGTRITPEDLSRVEEGERLLSLLGFSDFRVRLWRNGAKLQVTEDQMPQLLDRRQEVVDALTPLFRHTLLDLIPRTPSP